VLRENIPLLKAPMTIATRFRSLLLSLCVSCATTAFAATTTVSSIPDLQTAINAANPGDTIILANGIYTKTSDLTINRVGTADAPIIIRAQDIGGATIGGSGGIRFNSPAAYITLEGFILTHSGAINLPTGSHHCRISRNVIQLAIPAGTDVSYINISGDDHEISYNELRNKSTLGNMLDITGSGSQVGFTTTISTTSPAPAATAPRRFAGV
jgi:poly(beta-D-mannuronate) lyase